MNIFSVFFKKKVFHKKYEIKSKVDDNYHNLLYQDFPFLENNPFKYRRMSNAELVKKAKFINDSGVIVDSSNNNETRLRRCEESIKLLFEICACFPEERKYAESLKNTLNTKDAIKNDVVRFGKMMNRENKLTYEEFCDAMDYAKSSEKTNKFIPPKVDNTNIWDLKDLYKNDLNKMYECCVAALKESSRSKTTPDPYFFWRVAILAKKEKKYEMEVEVCRSFLNFVDRYTSEMTKKGKIPGTGFPDIAKSSKVLDMRKRLPKAIANLKKMGNYE